MSILTRPQLYTEINTYITDPLNNQITPAIVRMILEDMVDSSGNVIDTITSSSIIASPGAVNGGISSAIIGSPNSTIANGVTNSIIIGGSNVNVTMSGVVYINGQVLGTYDLATVMGNGNTTGGASIIMNNINQGGSILSGNSNANIAVKESLSGDKQGTITQTSKNTSGSKQAILTLAAVRSTTNNDSSTVSQITGNATDVQLGNKWAGTPAAIPSGGYSYLEIDQRGSSNTWYSGTGSAIITIKADDLNINKTSQTISPSTFNVTVNTYSTINVGSAIKLNSTNSFGTVSNVTLDPLGITMSVNGTFNQANIYQSANNSFQRICDGKNQWIDNSTNASFNISTQTYYAQLLMDTIGITLSNTEKVSGITVSTNLTLNTNIGQLSQVDSNGYLGNLSVSTSSVSFNSNLSSALVETDMIKFQTPGTASVGTVHSRSGLNLSGGYTNLYDRTNNGILTLQSNSSNIVITDTGITISSTALNINGQTGQSGTIVVGTYSLVFTNGILTAW